MLTINGEQEEARDGLTVLDLVRERGLDPARVAVELNGSVVGRDAFAAAHEAGAELPGLVGASVHAPEEDEWAAIEETLYLLSVPGMDATLEAGRNESVEDCASESELEW